MHNRQVVVSKAKEINARSNLVEIVLHTSLDVLSVNSDVVVSVRSGLFVIEAKSMHDLVSNGHGMQAASIERQRLSTSCSTSANVRVATTSGLLNAQVSTRSAVNECDTVTTIDTSLFGNCVHSANNIVAFSSS